MFGSRRSGISFLGAVLLVLLTVCSSRAQTYVWDQVNDDVLPNSGENIIFFAPLGQEFEPTFETIDVVQLWIRDFNAVHETGEFVVKIRTGTITGTVVGESDILSLAGHHVGIATFDLGETSVTPGSRYVIEIIQTQPPEASRAWAVESNGPHYPNGRKILSGTPDESNDLWFRVGVVQLVPVNETTWSRIKQLFI